VEVERNLKALGEERKTKMRIKRKKKSGTKFLLRFADDPIRFWVKSKKKSQDSKDKK